MEHPNNSSLVQSDGVQGIYLSMFQSDGSQGIYLSVQQFMLLFAIAKDKGISLNEAIFDFLNERSRTESYQFQGLISVLYNTFTDEISLPDSSGDFFLVPIGKGDK